MFTEIVILLHFWNRQKSKVAMTSKYVARLWGRILNQNLNYPPVKSFSSSPTTSPFSIRGQAKEGRPVYLDFQATTPLDPRVLDAMVI